ncbi:MAG: FtsX-like permease family protein [Candidatus Eisenbacteria bacterium]|nr:FtsX-like permease family protein [Candidatus Eisenbacteria bacterium]
MNVFESIASGMRSIWSHKLRSALTLFGIVVGVAAVVAMFSFVGGISKRIMEDFEQLGFDNVFFVSDRQPDNPRGLASLKVSKGLTLQDTEVLREEIPEIEWLCPTVATRIVGRAGNQARHFPVFGATPDGFPILKLELGAGRLINWLDVENHARVAVLGEIAKEDLFGDRNAVGEQMLIGKESFTIVGILRMKEFSRMFGGTGQEENHERVYIPITSGIHYFKGSKSIDYFAVRIRDGSDIGAVYERIHQTLLREHRGIEDFYIENIAEQIAEAKSGVERITQTWHTILSSIATVSLLVGGIGLLSVLIISVNERLREIGIRKAVGAEDRAIFQQFIIESVTISLFGGLVGLGVGAGLCKLITFGAAQMGQDFVIPVSGAGSVLGVSFAVAVGVIFGLYPAYKASRLDPIDAISRYA